MGSCVTNMSKELPYITSDLPGIGGSIKWVPTDFRVFEIPPPPPDGVFCKQSCHFWIPIQREGMNTHDVQDLLATILGYPNGIEIGMCGLKDKDATTIQTFSVPSFSRSLGCHLTSDEVVAVIQEQSQSRLLVAGPVRVSSKKLRRNMHLGNRFEILVRSLSLPSTKALLCVRSIQARLEETGWPNYYGDQRMGKGSRNGLRGLRMLESVQNAKGGARKRLRNSITRSQQKTLLLSAYSSLYFNIWLARRVEKGNFETLIDGDLLEPAKVPGQHCPNGETNQETKACPLRYNSTEMQHYDSTAALSILRDFKNGSLTYSGPYYGHGMILPAENTAARLAEEDTATSVSTIQNGTYKMLNMWGGRRAARISLKHMNLEIKEREGGLQFSFSLPKGSYATSFLREFMKVSIDEVEENAAPLSKNDKNGKEEERPKKRLKTIVSLRPVTLDYIQEKMNSLQVDFTSSSLEENLAPLKYKLLVLRSQAGGKSRKVIFTLCSSSNNRTIQEWSTKLGEKKTCRMMSEQDMKLSLGCSTLQELSPFSLCTEPHLPARVHCAIDEFLLSNSNRILLKFGVDGHHIGLQIVDYVKVVTAFGVAVETIKFSD